MVLVLGVLAFPPEAVCRLKESVDVYRVKCVESGSSGLGVVLVLGVPVLAFPPEVVKESIDVHRVKCVESGSSGLGVVLVLGVPVLAFPPEVVCRLKESVDVHRVKCVEPG